MEVANVAVTVAMGGGFAYLWCCSGERGGKTAEERAEEAAASRLRRERDEAERRKREDQLLRMQDRLQAHLPPELRHDNTGIRARRRMEEALADGEALAKGKVAF